jgi:CUG-BP- and ETR3-like factor
LTIRSIFSLFVISHNLCRNIQQHDIYTPAPSPYIASAVYPPDINSRRTASFDNGDFLPSPALDDTQGIYAASSFAQQHWAYAPPNIPFGNPQSSFQPNLQLRSPPRMQGGRGRGQPPQVYYPAAASPGPPIQTANTNKGPDGSNLFVFHIPNHFTNIDMYNLFCIYGNLLSVRIMVEKESGRSRGFGFVSYDNPESAALAIKNLNGFVVCNSFCLMFMCF